MQRGSPALTFESCEVSEIFKDFRAGRLRLLKNFVHLRSVLRAAPVHCRREWLGEYSKQL